MRPGFPGWPPHTACGDPPSGGATQAYSLRCSRRPAAVPDLDGRPDRYAMLASPRSSPAATGSIHGPPTPQPGNPGTRQGPRLNRPGGGYSEKRVCGFVTSSDCWLRSCPRSVQRARRSVESAIHRTPTLGTIPKGNPAALPVDSKSLMLSCRLGASTQHTHLPHNELLPTTALTTCLVPP